MVIDRLLLACCFVLACTRAYEDVPPGPEQGGAGGETVGGAAAAGETAGGAGAGGKATSGAAGPWAGWVRTEEGYFYNPDLYRGNDELGAPFELTLCPNGEVLVGLDVYLRERSLNMGQLKFKPRVPIAMVMKCTSMAFGGQLGESETEVTIGDVSAPDLIGPERLHCPPSSIVTSLRTGVDNIEPPPWVSSLGIECADAVDWHDPAGSQIANYTKQVGFSLVGTSHFADTCPKFFGVNGLSGRITEGRLEQLSGSCWATQQAWGIFETAFADQLPPLVPRD